MNTPIQVFATHVQMLFVQLSTPSLHHVLLGDSIACSFRADDQHGLLLLA